MSFIADYRDVWSNGVHVFVLSQNSVLQRAGGTWSRSFSSPYYGFAALSGIAYVDGSYKMMAVGGSEARRFSDGVWSAIPGSTVERSDVAGIDAVVGLEIRDEYREGRPKLEYLDGANYPPSVDIVSAGTVWKRGAQYFVGGGRSTRTTRQPSLGRLDGLTYVPLPWSGGNIVDGAAFGAGSVIAVETGATNVYSVYSLSSAGDVITGTVCEDCFLNRVAGYGNSIFAIGPTGDALWVKGSQRVVFRVPTALRAVFAVGECSAYAVGDGGRVLRF